MDIKRVPLPSISGGLNRQVKGELVKPEECLAVDGFVTYEGVWRKDFALTQKSIVIDEVYESTILGMDECGTAYPRVHYTTDGVTWTACGLQKGKVIDPDSLVSDGTNLVISETGKTSKFIILYSTDDFETITFKDVSITTPDVSGYLWVFGTVYLYFNYGVNPNALMRTANLFVTNTSVHTSNDLIGPIIADESTGTTLYCSMDSGSKFIKSTDSGATWAAGNQEYKILYADGAVIIGTDGSNIKRSADTGVTWPTVGTFTPYTSEGHSILVLGTDLYLITEQLEVTKSANAGVTWSTIKAANTALLGYAYVVYDSKLWFAGGAVDGSGQYTHTVYIGHSTDGVTWTTCTELKGYNAVESLCVHDSKLYTLLYDPYSAP